MQSEIIINRAQYAIGACVCHRLLGYRGVVVDVDPRFEHSDKRVNEQAKELISREQPWYHVLVHDTNQVTYVAEQNLRSDHSDEEIENPAVDLLFTRDEHGHYQRRVSLQ